MENSNFIQFLENFKSIYTHLGCISQWQMEKMCTIYRVLAEMEEDTIMGLRWARRVPHTLEFIGS